MWLKRFCLFTMLRWQVAHSSISDFALSCFVALRRVHAVARDAADIALVVLAARPEHVRAAVVAGRAHLARLLRREVLRVDDLRLVAARSACAFPAP